VKAGVTGIIVKANTPADLASEGLTLLHDPERYKTFQRQGLSWSTSLTWESVTAASLNMLKKQLA